MIMVQIAKNIEQVIFMLENFQYEAFTDVIVKTLLLCFGYVFCNYMYFFTYQCVDKKAQRIAVECCYASYLNKKLAYFSGQGTGDIVYSITSLAAEIGSYYAIFWQTLLVNVITLLVLFLTISSYNFTLAVTISLGMLALILLTSFLSNKIAEGT